MAVFALCAPLTDNSERPADLPHPGMKKINSYGQSFMQGWNDVSASSEERPGIKSIFSYDYWIDSTEITQRQYHNITGRNPVPESGRYGAGDQYPVCFVSWFDAALYCNARSKADGLDTVYRYTGRYAAPDGSVCDLEGLISDYLKDGYRLPTEAEWEFAAREASTGLPLSTTSELIAAESVAWFGANSPGTSQPVALKKPNSLGLYDLSGNVFEWTNDWKGGYNGDAVVNPIGFFNPNSRLERVLKGGSYNHGFEYLRPSYRSTPFFAAVSLRSEYVGFRCARGAIPDGHYLKDAGSIVFNFDYDSLGLYDDPVGGEAQQDFAVKMHLFWKFHRELDAVFIGDPTLYCGIDCGEITGFKSLNMGFNYCGISCMSNIMSNYLFVHAPKLKLIGIHVPFYFERYTDIAENVIGQSTGYRYDKSHDFWKDGVPDGFDSAVVRQPFPSLDDHSWDSSGMRTWYCKGWGDTIPDTTYARHWTINDSGYQAQFLELVRMIQETSARNIHLLVINFPESPYYKNASYYTRFGPGWETGREVIAQIKALERMYPYFHFYDANLDGNHDYTYDDAADYDRLCPQGAAKLSGRISTLIDSIIAR